MASALGPRNARQVAFALAVAKLIEFATARRTPVTLGEAYRPSVLAQWYAKLGSGVADSQHTDRLAIDLHLFVAGEYQTETEAYRPLGEHWKSLAPEARWGGDFPKPDGNHFEFIDP